jgi:hyperosmotically inducible protein
MRRNLLAITLGAALAIGAVGTALADDSKTTSTVTAVSQDKSMQPGTDTWITTKVKSELATTKGIPSTDISVTTTNGVVTLVGVLDNKAQIQKSIACAQAINGVRSVDSSALTSPN